MNDLRLVDTLFVLILPYTFKVFAVFMLRQQMMNIPDAYLDAAAIDGASLFRLFITYFCSEVNFEETNNHHRPFWTYFHWRFCRDLGSVFFVSNV